MAVTANRTVAIAFTSGLAFNVSFAAAANTSSPAETIILTLASGANQIELPTGGTVPTAATIVPPVGNTNTLTLKGTTADGGIGLHPTDPSVVTFATTTTTFCLTAGGTITGLRITYS